MTEEWDIEKIRGFWVQQASKEGRSPAASWKDQPAIDMEIRELSMRLQDGDKVLDVGCANGYSTVRLACSRRIHIRGIDYVPEMIEQARRRLQDMNGRLLGTVEFDVGDVMDLQESEEAYDKVVATRVIINLGHWDRQITGLLNCVGTLKKGGLLLLSEATLQGWTRLNTFRKEWGLSDIPMPPHNHYLDEKRVIEALSTELELLELNDFSSTYFVGTRVLKPLLIEALGKDIDVANADMEWNRLFSQLPAWGDYGTQKLFVFKKL